MKNKINLRKKDRLPTLMKNQEGRRKYIVDMSERPQDGGEVNKLILERNKKI